MSEPAAPDVVCWNCGAAQRDLALPLSRHQYCSGCAEALHCCRQCRLFAPQRADQCLEERAEHPTDKTAANFCDYFELRIQAAADPGADRHGAARARLDALFGGEASREPPDGAEQRASSASSGDGDRDARARLDALFGGESND